MDGLDVDYDKLFDVPKEFWKQEVNSIRKYFDEQVGEDLPKEMLSQLDQLEKRLNN